jgi:DNA-directed RNA polymerase specialized sigma24 family protein
MTSEGASGIRDSGRSPGPGGLCMSRDDGFVELIRRVRAGDEQASAELVRRYEPAIRVAVRARLTDPRLRRLLDSMDVCQSVLGNFFARAASGQFELERPEHLVSLLATMARNRVTNHALQQQAARRDQRRIRLPAPGGEEQVDPGLGPCAVVEGKDLIEAVRSRLSPEESQIADQWASGKAWGEIGAQIGRSADAVRVRLGRAFDRVRRDLRLVR